MSPYALIVRLPSGREYWWTEQVPLVGENVSHAGSHYVVVSCEPEDDDRFVLTLEQHEVTGDPIAVRPAV
jgi:hypothetical protein